MPKVSGGGATNHFPPPHNFQGRRFLGHLPGLIREEMVELMMAIEEEFSTPSLKVEIPDEDAESIATVQDAVDYLKGLGVDEHLQ